MQSATDRHSLGASCECAPSGTPACPVCGQAGQPVPGQTVKALLTVSLRAVREVRYLFCRTQTCPVVYFSSDGQHSFTQGEVRERVYQKEPMAADAPVCYCFRHTAGALRLGSTAARAAILDDIHAGIEAGQCACDLRNPQGACCLGNVRRLVREFDGLVTSSGRGS